MSAENKDDLFKKQYQKFNLITTQVFLLTGLWHEENYKFDYQKGKVIFTPGIWKNNLILLEVVLCITKMYFTLNMVTNAQFILCEGDQLRMGGSSWG